MVLSYCKTAILSNPGKSKTLIKSVLSKDTGASFCVRVLTVCVCLTMDYVGMQTEFSRGYQAFLSLWNVRWSPEHFHWTNASSS